MADTTNNNNNNANDLSAFFENQEKISNSLDELAKSIREMSAGPTENRARKREEAREAEQREEGRTNRVVEGIKALGGTFENLGSAAKGTGEGIGGILGGAGGLLGKGLAGAGVGAGAAAAGIGALLAGGGYLLDKMMEIDGEEIKKNILALFSISDEVGGKLNFFTESGVFVSAMAGIGAGLIAFSAGSGAAAAVDKFSEPGWSERIKENVGILLSITDFDQIGNIDQFKSTMGGIGTGLLAFSAGSGIAAAVDKFSSSGWADRIKENVGILLSITDFDQIGNIDQFKITMKGIGDGLMSFAGGSLFAAISDSFGKDGWAQRIKDNSEILLSIPDSAEVGNVEQFKITMEGLGDGLMSFAGGQFFAAITDSFGKDGWAQRIKDNSETLLSIPDSAEVGNIEQFKTTMSGISDGLMSFAGGQVAAAIANFFSSDSLADKIKNQTKTLLSIIDETEGKDPTKFTATMSELAKGILVFTGSEAIGTLASVGEKILGFFGSKSPFAKIMEIADNAEQLNLGSDALGKIGDALEKFGSIKIGKMKIDFEDMAKNLAKAIPFLQKLANGGIIEGGLFGIGEVDFGEGILDPSLKLDELAEAIGKINFIFGASDELPGKIEGITESQSMVRAGAESIATGVRSSKIKNIAEDFIDESMSAPIEQNVEMMAQVATENKPRPSIAQPTSDETLKALKEANAPQSVIDQYKKEIALTQTSTPAENIKTMAETVVSPPRFTSIGNEDTTVKAMREAGTDPRVIEQYQREMAMANRGGQALAQTASSSPENIKTMARQVSSLGQQTELSKQKEFTDYDEYERALTERRDELLEQRIERAGEDISPRKKEQLKRGASMQAHHEIVYKHPYSESQVQTINPQQIERNKSQQNIMQGTVNDMAMKTASEVSATVANTNAVNNSSSINNITVNAPSSTTNIGNRSNSFQGTRPAVAMNF